MAEPEVVNKDVVPPTITTDKDTTPPPAPVTDKETPAPAADSPKPGEDKKPSLMDDAVSKGKLEVEAEEKRLLETPDEQLNPEELVKKGELIKANEDKDKEKGNVVPEKYEFKIPEGMVVDQEYMDKASEIMKKHSITQAAASELGELAAAQIKKVNAENAKQQELNFKSFVEDLRKETIAELSKEGKDPNRELAFAAKSRDRLASPELIEVLNESGLADHKAVVAHFIAIGKQISEGTMLEGKSVPSGTVDVLGTLYPTTTQK